MKCDRRMLPFQVALTPVEPMYLCPDVRTSPVWPGLWASQLDLLAGAVRRS